MTLRMTEDEYKCYLHRSGKSKVVTKKKRKYKNDKITVDGVKFDSIKEAEYYNSLKLRLNAGEIKGFCRQAEFILQEGFADQLPIKYYADFVVFHIDGTAEIVDTKGFKTEVFKLKNKLFKKKFPGLEIILR